MTCRNCEREISPVGDVQTAAGLCVWCDFASRPREKTPDASYYRWVLEADEALKRIFPGRVK